MAILAREDVWTVGRHPVSERTLAGLSVLLQSNALKQALQPYCLGGPFGQLLTARRRLRSRCRCRLGGERMTVNLFAF
jgi:type IV secretory pathway VirB4 component